MSRYVFISDTHNFKDIIVPEGDVLIHAGDVSSMGTVKELIAFNAWMGTHSHKVKLVVPGNHDWLAYVDPTLARNLATNFRWLIDESYIHEGVHIYGSPWTPQFGRWAYMKEREEINWDHIPDNVDILVTHGPPHGILDEVLNFSDGIEGIVNAGCEALLRRALAVKPIYHVFGHIHEGYGELEMYGIKFINASICTRWYRPENVPITVEVAPHAT